MYRNTEYASIIACEALYIDRDAAPQVTIVFLAYDRSLSRPSDYYLLSHVIDSAHNL